MSIHITQTSCDFILPLLEQDFFTSLRADYPRNDIWIEKSASEKRPCWVIMSNSNLIGLVILKPESSKELESFGISCSDVLKIGLFKITPPKGLNTLFADTWSSIQDYAKTHGFQTIYGSIHPHHKQAITLFKKIGFQEAPYTKGNEIILFQHILPQKNHSFTLRTFAPTDAQAVYSLHMRAILETCAPAYTPEVIREWVSHITPEGYLRQQAKGESYHVAVTPTGKVIGFSGWKKGKLCGLYVHPEFQGIGAGTALLRAAEAEASHKGTPITKLVATLNGVSFYKKNGYTVTTRGSVVQNGVKIPRYYMKKVWPA